MRDVPINKDLIRQALARSAQPLHRFHGEKTPTDRQRTPVAYASPAKVKDGVAKLRLYDVIDSWGGPWGVSAAEFVDVLDELGNDVQRIELHLNSPGGEVWEGLAIMNALRQHAVPVTAVVDGIAASAASFIAVAADELVMGQNTRLMIHDALGICIGQATDMHDFGDWLSNLSDEIASIYASKAGGDVKDWRRAMLAETWYSAQEAVDSGLADSVAGATEGDAEPPAENRFDLKAVGAKYTDRSEAPAPPMPGNRIRVTVNNVADALQAELDRFRHAGNRHGLKRSV